MKRTNRKDKKIIFSRILTSPTESNNRKIIFYWSLIPWPHFYIEIKIYFKHTSHMHSTNTLFLRNRQTRFGMEQNLLLQEHGVNIINTWQVIRLSFHFTLGFVVYAVIFVIIIFFLCHAIFKTLCSCHNIGTQRRTYNCIDIYN